jgi:hypothetical protein
MRGRRLWCKLQSQIGEIRVCVVKTLIEEGVECEGLFDSDGKEILILSSVNESKMRMRLLHEMLHLAIASPTGDIFERLIGGRTRESRERREEMMVGLLEPVLYDLLARNNLLRLPKPPRFI